MSTDNQSKETTKQSTKQDEITIGDLLKSSRERMDISLKIISGRTKIGVTMLELLENNELDKLPNKAYVTGYVKSIAKELGVSLDDGLKSLDYTYNLTNPGMSLATHKIQTEQKKPTSKQPPLLKIVLISSFVLLAIFISVYNKIAKEDQVAEQETITPQVVTNETPLNTENPSTEDEETSETLKTDGTSIVATPVPTPTAIPKKVAKKNIIKKKVGDKKYTFYQAKSNLFSIANSSDQKKASSFLTRRSLISGKQNVFINATHGTTWLTFKKDDYPVRKVLLPKGKTLSIRGESIRIFFGNINSAKIFLNNKLLSYESKSGVKSLIFPIEDQVKFKLPLFVFQKDGTVISSDEYLNNLER